MDEPHHESKQLVVVVVVGVYIASKSVFPRKERKIEEGDRSARSFASYAISIERQKYTYINPLRINRVIRKSGEKCLHTQSYKI
jgi:hypothetical protein